MQDAITPVTHLVLLNLTSETSRTAVAAAAAFLSGAAADGSRMSLLLLHPTGTAPSLLACTLAAAQTLITRVDSIPVFLAALAQDESLWRQLAGASCDEAAINANLGKQIVAAAEAAGLSTQGMQRTLAHIASEAGSAALQVFFATWPPIRLISRREHGQWSEVPVGMHKSHVLLSWICHSTNTY
jgi:hypothetical protein